LKFKLQTKTFRIIAALLPAVLLTGCPAHMLTIRLVNTSTQPVSTIIVDYPSATFGKDKLAPAETFSSPVKITDAGPLKVQFTDASGAVHTYTGLKLHPNQEGSIEIRLDQSGAQAEAR
jgi:hypothetical protein